MPPQRGVFDEEDDTIHTPSATVKTPSHFSKLWPAYLCVFVDFMGLALTIPIQPFLADEFGASATAISALVGVFSLGQLLGNMVMGKLSDKIGRRPIIMASLSFSTASYVLCGFAESVAVLFIARGLCGICGGTMPVAQAMVLDVVSDFRERPKYLGLCGASLGMGFIIGPAIGALAAETAGVAGAFFVCAALSGAVTVLACLKVEETNPAVTGKQQAAAAAGPPDKKGPPQGKPDAQPSAPSKGFGLPIWGCVLSMFLNAFCFSTMNALATLTINVQFGWGPTEIGIFLAIVGFLQVLMTAGIGPWLINKIGAPLTNVIGSVWSVSAAAVGLG